jgi:hypothetical protein
MTDKAFKPPTEAAMAMTGNEWRTDATGNSKRAPLAGLVNRRPDTDFSFMGLEK